MKSDIDEMLHLTADIAEELLAIKDNDGEVSHGLCAKIDRLAGLAVANIRESATLTERIEMITEKIIRNRAKEIMDGADAPMETEHDEAEALIENARKEAMESEDGSNQAECHNADHPQQSIAASAEFEESADADEDIQDTTNGDVYELTGNQLRGIFSLNDIFLYQRTLFGGSSAKFNAALDEIARLSNVEELKTFLSEKCNINLKNREAKEFLVALSQFFPS